MKTVLFVGLHVGIAPVPPLRLVAPKHRHPGAEIQFCVSSWMAGTSQMLAGRRQGVVSNNMRISGSVTS